MDKLVFTLVSDYLPDEDIVNLSLVSKRYQSFKSKMKGRFWFYVYNTDFLVKYNLTKIEIYGEIHKRFFESLKTVYPDYYNSVDLHYYPEIKNMDFVTEYMIDSLTDELLEKFLELYE